MQRPALTRSDHHRRTGTLGELETVVERLDRAVEIWSDDEQPRWSAVFWLVEQLRREAGWIAAHYPSGTIASMAAAMIRNLDTVGDRLEEIGRFEAEVRAEVQGAAHHVDAAYESCRLDQHFADQYRLQAAGLDEWTLVPPNAAPAPGVA